MAGMLAGRLYFLAFSRSGVSNSLQPHGLQTARLLCPWGFSRQEHWSGLPFPSPRDLPKPGIEFFRQEHWSGLPFPTPGDLPTPRGLNLRLSHLLRWRRILYHPATWVVVKPHLCLTKSQPSGTDPSSKNPFSSNVIPTFALALGDANLLKLKLHSFGHLMQRTDSLEKTL